MTDEPQTIWGLPVVIDDTVPPDEIRLIAGRGVIRQDGILEWEGDHWIIRNIGEPYRD